MQLKLRASTPRRAVKPAAALTRTGLIGVLATQNTLQSEQYAQLLSRYASSVRVIGKDCQGWVEAVERGDLSSPETQALVAKHVRPLAAMGVDTLVLGCTHFPFLRQLIERSVESPLVILDTGEPVARQLQRRLEEAHLLAAADVPLKHRFLSSRASCEANAFVHQVWPEISAIEELAA